MSKPWHSKTIEDTLAELGVSESGLSPAEAQKRLAEYGSNELQKEKRSSPIKMFLEQFKDILLIILLIATGLSLAIGEIIDAIVIVAIVIATVVLGFIQE
jgi:Ca2+-transporting ATPase